jgi:hypothetical protein
MTSEKGSVASGKNRLVAFALAFAIASWLWASLVGAAYQITGGYSGAVPYLVVILCAVIGQAALALTALLLGRSALLQIRPGRGLAIAAMVIASLGLGAIVLALLAFLLLR